MNGKNNEERVEHINKDVAQKWAIHLISLFVGMGLFSLEIFKINYLFGHTKILLS